MAGVTDVATFGRFGSYCNMMTGNTFQLSVAIGTLRGLDVLYYTALLMCFVAGIGGYRVVDVRRQRRCTPSAFAPVVLALFCASDVILARPRVARCALLPLAAACGMLNAASSETTGTITCMGEPQSSVGPFVACRKPGALRRSLRHHAAARCHGLSGGHLR